jgi:hypothetical protein
MTLKICSSGHKVTTRNAMRVIRDEIGLHFNCPHCKTTLFIKDKARYEKMRVALGYGK